MPNDREIETERVHSKGRENTSALKKQSSALFGLLVFRLRVIQIANLVLYTVQEKKLNNKTRRKVGL